MTDNHAKSEDFTGPEIVWLGDKFFDQDRREPGRYVIVERLDGDYAWCHAEGKNGGRLVRIRINRLLSRAFKRA
jgi:hypothetical protein